MRIKMMSNYSSGNRLFKQNEIFTYDTVRYKKIGCPCKEPIKHYQIVVDGITYLIPDTYACDTNDEPSQAILPDVMRENIGGNNYVNDFNPYRLQNDQAKIQELANTVRM
jgi:hypothetical protein